MVLRLRRRWPDERFHMNFFYIGPEFVVRTFFSDYWSAKAALGLGAFFSREKVRDNSRLDYGLDGWGGHFQLGLEYRLAEHVGVGLNGGYILGWFPGKDFAREFFPDDGLGELGKSGKPERIGRLFPLLRDGRTALLFLNILPGRGPKFLGHLLSEFFVDGVVYAAADVGGEPYAAVDGLMPLCAGQAGQVDAADTIAYQP